MGLRRIETRAGLPGGGDLSGWPHKLFHGFGGRLRCNRSSPQYLSHVTGISSHQDVPLIGTFVLSPQFMDQASFRKMRNDWWLPLPRQEVPRSRNMGCRFDLPRRHRQRTALACGHRVQRIVWSCRHQLKKRLGSFRNEFIKRRTHCAINNLGISPKINGHCARNTAEKTGPYLRLLFLGSETVNSHHVHLSWTQHHPHLFTEIDWCNGFVHR